MIVVTNAGIVKDTVIRIPEEMHADHLYSISKMLTEMLKDRPMHEVRAEFAAMFRDMQSHRRLFANVLDVLENELREDHASDMVVGGSANLLNYPEYSDIEKARNFLTVLESKEKLYPLLQDVYKRQVHQLVFARDDEEPLGPEQGGGHPVAVAVDVEDVARSGDGVGRTDIGLRLHGVP